MSSSLIAGTIKYFDEKKQYALVSIDDPETARGCVKAIAFKSGFRNFTEGRSGNIKLASMGPVVSKDPEKGMRVLFRPTYSPNGCKAVVWGLSDQFQGVRDKVADRRANRIAIATMIARVTGYRGGARVSSRRR